MEKERKKRLKLFFVIIIIFLLGIGVGSVIHWGDLFKRSQPQKETKKEESPKKKILYYKSSMDPNFTSKTPGKDSMGMDLIPVYEEEEEEGGSEKGGAGTVKISPEMVQTIGVTSIAVAPRRLVKEIRTVGRVDYNEKDIKIITSRVAGPGHIDRLFVNFTGMVVKKNDPLVSIYSPDLFATQKEYLIALEMMERVKEGGVKEAVEGAKSLLEASKNRLILWGVTPKQIAELEQRKTPSTHLIIYSSVSGTVIDKYVFEDMYINERTPLYRIAGLSTVWLYADIYEQDISLVRIGQEMSITLPSYPGIKLGGRISFIDPVLDSSTRTIRVRVEIPNSRGVLKPGMYATATLKVSLGDKLLAIPKDAIIYSGKRTIVLIDRGKGSFSPREVTLGSEVEDYYQVIEGLSRGEKVVTSANFLIDSESKLRLAIARMGEENKAPSNESPKEVPQEHKGH